MDLDCGETFPVFTQMDNLESFRICIEFIMWKYGKWMRYPEIARPPIRRFHIDPTEFGIDRYGPKGCELREQIRRAADYLDI